MSKTEETGENTATPYVAFLRGINNIGSKTVKMDELKSIFEATGFKNVKTILTSGNIVFETTISETYTIITKTEKQLERKLRLRSKRNSSHFRRITFAGKINSFQPDKNYSKNNAQETWLQSGQEYILTFSSLIGKFSLIS